MVWIRETNSMGCRDVFKYKRYKDIQLGCRILIYVDSIALVVIIIMMIKNGQHLYWTHCELLNILRALHIGAHYLILVSWYRGFFFSFKNIELQIFVEQHSYSRSNGCGGPIMLGGIWQGTLELHPSVWRWRQQAVFHLRGNRKLLSPFYWWGNWGSES